MTERTPSHDQTKKERKDEQDEINNFNQNTDYDASASLRDDAKAAVEVESQEDASNDLAMAQFILSNRIYDVLLALLQTQSPDKARDLLELHSSGNLLGTAPSWNGTFLTDMMNEENDEPPTE